MALKCMKYLKHRMENYLIINATVALDWKKKTFQFAFFIAWFTKNIELKRSDEKNKYFHLYPIKLCKFIHIYIRICLLMSKYLYI